MPIIHQNLTKPKQGSRWAEEYESMVKGRTLIFSFAVIAIFTFAGCNKIKELLDEESDVTYNYLSFTLNFSTPVEGNIPVGTGNLNYRVDTTSFSKDSLISLRLEKGMKDSIEAVISFDGTEVERTRLFPHTYNQKVVKKGDHELFLKAGVIKEGSDDIEYAEKKISFIIQK